MKLAFMSLFMIAGAALAADDSGDKKFLKELEGVYKVAAAEKSAGPAPAEFLNSIERVTIKGNKLSFVFKSEGAKTEEKTATISVDTANMPVQIDMKPEDGPMKNETVLGIVSTDGDTVKLCFNDARDNKRPTEFKTSKDDKTVVITLKKTKE